MQSDLYKVCQQSVYSNSFRNYFALNQTDAVIVYSILPFAAMAVMLNIYFFYRFPNAREPPFDILLFITIFSLVNQCVYLSTVIYNSLEPPNRQNFDYVPDTFLNFCLTTGTLHFIAQIGAIVFNIVFCLYYTCKIKNPLKSWVKQNKEVHALCFIVIGIVTVIVYITNMIGVSTLGICGLKVAKASVFIELFICLVYVLVLVGTSILFLKYLKRISRHDTKARAFYKYFFLYTLLISFIYLLEFVVMMLLIVDCFTGISEETYQIFARIGNVCILVTPIITTFIISFHPEFGRKFVPETLKLFRRHSVQPQRQSFYNDLLTTNRTSIDHNTVMIELKDLNSDNPGYLSTIKQSNRLSLLSTILGCISLLSSQRSRHLQEQGKRVEERATEDAEIFTWNFTDEYEVQVDAEVVNEHREHFVEKVPVMQIKFISHAMSVFESLMDQDGVDFVERSTNPNKNLDKIYKNAQADGGSSGQFFFFTHDNLLLLKTISSKELSVLMQRLQAYYLHMRNHPESLIVKIYGVFTVINPETSEQLHFMMMGNLCQDINKKYIMRIYDCKGSSHKREVIKQTSAEQEPEYYNKTLKDVDFDRIEHKVWIPREVSQNVKQTLKNDSLFFLDNGLIDYSLIIIKIDYKAYTLDLEDRKPTFNTRTMYLNEKQTNMIYVFGIIDYLETWNVKKKGERWYKSLFNQSDTISSQSPAYYSKRFCENLIQKIF